MVGIQKTANRESELKSLVALTSIKRIGTKRIYQLKKLAGSVPDIFNLSYEQITSIYGIGQGIADNILQFDQWDEVDKIIKRTYELGASIITQRDDCYPPLLKHIYDPPLILWILGNKQALMDDALAVVGTRSCSSYGKKSAAMLVKDLVDQNITIVSGLAYGIDTIAHKTTVEQGSKTVAVLGSGIDVIYPGTNRKLAERIIEHDGAIISEFTLGTKPDAPNFPVRNRIVSGMTMGTLVVESGLKGGSMITINSALSQNREVFAVPHPLGGNNSDGCNTLIRDGMAKLVIGAEDILNEITHLRSFSVEEQETGGIDNRVETKQKAAKWERADLSEKQELICKQLEQKETPMHIDDLAEQLESPTSALMADLLSLEMMECIEQRAGKYFTLL